LKFEIGDRVQPFHPTEEQGIIVDKYPINAKHDVVILEDGRHYFDYRLHHPSYIGGSEK